MTNNTSTALYAGLLLLAIIIGACTKDSIPPESNYKQPHNFRLSAAREFYEENFGNLSLPELYLKPIVQTKGSNYFHNLTQTPLWDNFHFVENAWSYIYEIPILYNTNLNAYFGHITEDGKMIKKDKDIKLQSNLIIQKYKKSGNIHVFLSTIIGHNTTPDKPTGGLSPWLWTGDRRNFTGYLFFTNTDGSFRGAFQYKNGTRKDIRLDIYDHTEEYNHPQEVFSIRLGSPGTKGAGMQEPSKWCWNCQRAVDPKETYCPQCGDGVLDEIVITPNPPGSERCSKCDFLIENCVCGREPGNDGDVCPYCGFTGCSGECRNIDDGDGDDNNGPPPPEPSIQYYNISLLSNNSKGGSLMGGGSYKSGNPVSITALCNTNYVFSGWSEGFSFITESSDYSFIADKNRTLKASFHLKNSKCGILARKYKHNSRLRNTINLLNNKISTNNSIEYAYAKIANGEDILYTGDNNSVSIILDNNSSYEYIIHNHPSNRLIPSSADIYKLYKETCNNTMPIGSCFLIRTDSGCISIEVEDFESLETLALNTLSSNKEQRNFDKFILYEIIGDEDLTSINATNKVILFLSEYGLKFTYTATNNNSYNWSNIEIHNNIINYTNCTE